MRILHISHTGLPDRRIERIANMDRGLGHRPLFAGHFPDGIRIGDTPFADIDRCLPKIRAMSMLKGRGIKREWLAAVEYADPDIIHVHDIIAAQFLIGTDLPVVYDDHECWSQYFLVMNRSMGMMRRILRSPLYLMIPRWEDKIRQTWPIITSNARIAEYHRDRGCEDISILFNYPLSDEVEGLDIGTVRSGLVYSGNDFNMKRFARHRDMTGLTDILYFDVLSGLPYRNMLRILTRYEIGLIPWLPVPFHEYCHPNRIAEYLHAGLAVVAPRLMYDVQLKGFPAVYPFTDYSDIISVAAGIINDPPDRDTIVRFAREHLIVDGFRDTLNEIYTRVVSS